VEAILAAHLAHAACHEVSSVDARLFAANCASSSAGALSCFATRFSGRADRLRCAKDDGNSCIKLYVVPEGHSQGLTIVVGVCRHPKVIGVLVLPSLESPSILEAVFLTFFGVLPDVMFTMLPASGPSFLAVSFVLLRALFVTDRFHEERHTCWPIYGTRFCHQADGMRAANAESIHAEFASSRKHARYSGEGHMISFVCGVDVYELEGEIVTSQVGKLTLRMQTCPSHSMSGGNAAARGATQR
jgi:hypothetical protein